MPPRSFTLVLLVVGFGSLGCPPTEEKDKLFIPVPMEAHEVPVKVDAYGDPRMPAHVALYLARGSLRLAGGGTHTLEGTVKGGVGDPPPRVDVTRDRIAIVQTNVGGAPPREDASYALVLGKTPVALEVRAGAGPKQAIDFGGVALAEARVYAQGDNLAIDWSAPNALAGAPLFLEAQGGYIDVSHLGRAGGGAVVVRNRGGKVTLGVGAVTGAVAIEVDNTPGSYLVLKVPAGVPASATVEGGKDVVAANGWREEGAGYALGDAAAPKRVTLASRGTPARVELVAEP